MGRLQNESSEVLEETGMPEGVGELRPLDSKGQRLWVKETDQRLSPGGSAGLGLASMPGKNIPGEGTQPQKGW